MFSFEFLNQSFIFSIIFSLIAFLILSYAFQRFPFINSIYNSPQGTLPSKLVAPLNFENDINYLHFIIDFKLNNFKVFFIDTAAIAGKPILSDKDFTDMQNSLMEEVLKSISKQYRGVLYHYFSSEGLNNYIAEYITNKLTELFLTKNLSFFNSSGKKAKLISNSIQQKDL